MEVKKEKVKPNNKLVWLSMLAVFTLIGLTATSSAENVVWFEPGNSSVSGCGNTINAELLLTATEGVNGFDIWIEYDHTCANIREATAGNFTLMFMAKYETGATQIIGATSDLNDVTGDRLKLATITIECLDCGGCNTSLDLTESCQLGNAAGGNPVTTWKDGGFACGSSPEHKETPEGMPAPPIGGGGGGEAPLDTDGDGISDVNEMGARTDWKDPCDPNPESAACLAVRPPTPIPALSTPISAPPTPISASPTPTPTATPAPSPTPTPATPSFEVVFAIFGLLAVAYILRRGG